MENSRLEKEKVIEDMWNPFRIIKEENETAFKDTKNIFRKKRQIKGTKNIVLRSIKNLSEYKKEEENPYKYVKVDIFWNNNYIEYKINSDKIKIWLKNT